MLCDVNRCKHEAIGYADHWTGGGAVCLLHALTASEAGYDVTYSCAIGFDGQPIGVKLSEAMRVRHYLETGEVMA